MNINSLTSTGSSSGKMSANAEAKTLYVLSKCLLFICLTIPITTNAYEKV